MHELGVRAGLRGGGAALDCGAVDPQADIGGGREDAHDAGEGLLGGVDLGQAGRVGFCLLYTSRCV